MAEKVATAAVAVRPPIEGLDMDTVDVLLTMGDTFALHYGITGATFA